MDFDARFGILGGDSDLLDIKLMVQSATKKIICNVFLFCLVVFKEFCWSKFTTADAMTCNRRF